MKKLLFYLIFLSFCCPAVSFSEPTKNSERIIKENLISGYRAYPFQWIFPEYYYKAKIIRVKKEEKTQQGYSNVSFFGLNAFIPSAYTYEITRRHDTIYFKSKAGNFIMMFKSPDSSIVCSKTKQNNMKDYCSAYKTPQEYNHKLFTLTPETAKSIGDKWIVHDKGGVFENAKNIEVYSDDLFMAYVKVIKASLGNAKKNKFSHEIVLFHANGPLDAYITICFIGEKNDTPMKHFISTIE